MSVSAARKMKSIFTSSYSLPKIWISNRNSNVNVQNTDQEHWTNEKDPKRAVEQNELHFRIVKVDSANIGPQNRLIVVRNFIQFTHISDVLVQGQTANFRENHERKRSQECKCPDYRNYFDNPANFLSTIHTAFILLVLLLNNLINYFFTWTIVKTFALSAGSKWPTSVPHWTRWLSISSSISSTRWQIPAVCIRSWG